MSDNVNVLVGQTKKVVGHRLLQNPKFLGEQTTQIPKL